jgi:hypothetical protein
VKTITAYGIREIACNATGPGRKTGTRKRKVTISLRRIFPLFAFVVMYKETGSKIFPMIILAGIA